MEVSNQTNLIVIYPKDRQQETYRPKNPQNWVDAKIVVQ